jgi:preprotein translocase subunit YajC
MYFLLIRPQRRRRAEAQALQSSIGVGDEVVTTSGVYGFITAVEEETGIIWLEIDDDVQIRVSRAAISGKVNAGAKPAPAADEPATVDADDATAGPAATPGSTTPSRPSLKGGAKDGQDEGAGNSEPGTE